MFEGLSDIGIVVQVFSVAMLLLGALMLARSTVFIKKIHDLTLKGNRKKQWHMVRGLIYFFLIGYVAALVLLLIDEQILLELLVGCVFVCGAGFVYIALNIGYESMQDLKLKRDRYTHLVSEVKDYAIIMLDSKGLVWSWNKGAEYIKGYSEQEATWLDFREFYTEEDRALNKPDLLLAEAKVHGRATDEGWRVKKDGSHFWASVSITALHDAKGNVVSFSKVTRDLTERKKAEDARQAYAEALEYKNQELLDSELKIRHMVEEVKDYAIIMLDKEGNVLTWNQGAENIKGYTAKEIVGHSFRRFYTIEDAQNGRHWDLLMKATEQGKANDEGWRVRKDGSVFWASVSITAIHNNDNEVVSFSKVTRDLTERKQAEDEQKKHLALLQSKNKELEQFTYIASHDLQEPLATLKSLVGILKEDGPQMDEEEAAQVLGFVDDTTGRMSQLIGGLLDHGRLGRGKQMTTIDVNSLVNDVLVDLQHSIKEHDADIKVGALPMVKGFDIELRLLFQNLIGNALKFKDAGRRVVVELSAIDKHDHWEFVVADNGIGIKEEHLDKVFVIFQRLHDRDEFEGTGIGLAHCRKIAELHGGDIWASSELGVGSQFHFTIPKVIIDNENEA